MGSSVGLFLWFRIIYFYLYLIIPRGDSAKLIYSLMSEWWAISPECRRLLVQYLHYLVTASLSGTEEFLPYWERIHPSTGQLHWKYLLFFTLEIYSVILFSVFSAYLLILVSLFKQWVAILLPRGHYFNTKDSSQFKLLLREAHVVILGLVISFSPKGLWLSTIQENIFLFITGGLWNEWHPLSLLPSLGGAVI